MLDIIALAEVPHCWAISSAWSVFGICYIIVAIGIIVASGGLKGGLTLINFALVGAFLVSMAGPGENPPTLTGLDSGLALYVVCKDDNDNLYWGNYVHTVRLEQKWRFNNDHNTFDDDDRGCYDPEPKIYAMHDPAFKGYISPKVFHPAAFFWSPFLMGLIGMVGGFLWNIFGIMLWL